MIDDIHFGVQYVSTGGYEIATPKKIYSRHFSSPYKTTEQQKIEAGEIDTEASVSAIDGREGMTRVYDPFEEKSLFRIFPSVEGEDAGIIKFANQYGLLGEGYTSEPIFGNQIEPLSLWRSQINKMKRAVELWDHIQQKDEGWLLEHIKWKGDRNQPVTMASVIYQDDFHQEIIASEGKTAPEQFTYGETNKPARIYLQRIINRELKDRIVVRLLYKADWSCQHNIITPNNLIGFMWLQLALTIEGDLKYKKCAVCSKPFRVDPSERGKPRRFCSDACKSKDYRTKRKVKTNE